MDKSVTTCPECKAGAHPFRTCREIADLYRSKNKWLLHTRGNYCNVRHASYLLNVRHSVLSQSNATEGLEYPLWKAREKVAQALIDEFLIGEIYI